MASKDLVFRFLGVDGGAGREFDKMAGKSAALEHAVGKMALGFAAAGVAIGVESVRAAAKFQTAMELIHTQAGRSQKTVDQMSKAVLAMSAGVATGPDELAKGLYHLASTGMSTAKSLQALKIAAEGAKLGGADLESVTNALNATLASGIKGAQNMSQAMGALNAVVGAGDMRMQDLAEAMGTGVLAAVKGFGLSLNDVGAALATFGDNNIRGADAATQLRMAVLFMAKPAAGAKDALKSLGMNSQTLAKDMGKGGLGLALTDLHDRLIKAGDTGSKMGQVLLDMFGHKAGTGIAILEQQFSRFQQKQEEVHQGSKNFASSWTGYTKTFGYSWDRARTAFQTMTIEIGQKLLPTATHAMNWIGTTGVADLEKFSGWVSRNKTPIEDIAKVLAAIAAFRFASSKLNDVSRLLGIGGKAAGGGLLGGTKAGPVHVWVDNPNFGGKGGPGAVSTGEKVAAGGATAAKTALGDLKDAVKLARAGQVGEGLRTGLQGLARSPIDPLSVVALAILDRNKSINKMDFVGQDYQQRLSHSTVGQQRVASQALMHLQNPSNFPGAGVGSVTSILKYGSKVQINQLGALAQKNQAVAAALQEVATHAKAAAAGMKDFSGDTGASTKAAIANARAMDAAEAQATRNVVASLRKIPGAMQQVAAEAKAAGLTIGQALDAGVTVGIKQGSGQIEIVSTQVIDGVRHSMMTRARAASPSKMTREIGLMLTDGLSLGLRAGKKGVGQAASELMDTVRGGVMGAGSLGNVANSTTADTLGAMGGGTSIKDILAFTHGQVVQDRGFARNLAIARKHGLSKSVAQQIAQLGPEQGAAIAASIAGASRSQIHQLNRDESSISQAGRQIGGVVSLSDTTIAKLGRAVGHAARPHVTSPAQLDRHNGKKILSH